MRLIVSTNNLRLFEEYKLKTFTLLFYYQTFNDSFSIFLPFTVIKTAIIFQYTVRLLRKIIEYALILYRLLVILSDVPDIFIGSDTGSFLEVAEERGAWTETAKFGKRSQRIFGILIFIDKTFEFFNAVIIDIIVIITIQMLIE